MSSKLHIIKLFLVVALIAVCINHTATLAAAADDYEPGNTYSQAKTIQTNGILQNHEISPANDIDWVRFVAISGNGYMIETFNLSANLDTYIHLFSTDGVTQITDDDDSGVGTASKINWTCLSSGTYYVKIRSFNYSTTGSYDIAVTESSSTPSNLVWLNQYFPLMVNNSWTIGNGITISVEGVETISGVQTKEIYRSDQNAYMFFRQDQEGTRRFKEELAVSGDYGIFEPPLKELPANAIIGNTYSYSSTDKVYTSGGTHQNDLSVWFTTDVLGFEDVSLPSPADINGSQHTSFLNCLKLRHTVSVDGNSFTETSWYAKDLGFVKLSNSGGTFYINSATTYYDGTLGGPYNGTIHNSQGINTGTSSITLEQNGSNLSGNVGFIMDNGITYNLDIKQGYASGPNAVGHASDGQNTLDFALTKNGGYLTGPYDSNFMGYGIIAPWNPPVIGPVVSGGGGGGGGGGCFIATAAYGSPFEPHIKVLRDFRDRFLLTNSIGVTFVNFYYTYSPPVAEIIADHDNLRFVVRWSLLPIVGLSWVALNLGPMTILIFMLLLGSCFICFGGIRRKFREK